MIEYLIKKPPLPSKTATILLIKVKSCTILLLTLLTCIRNCLQAVLRRNLLILNTYHVDTPYVRQQGYDEPRGYFAKPKGTREQKKSGKH